MILRNADVFLPDGKFHRCDVRFNATVEALGHFSPRPGETLLDGSGCYLIPGLIDIHTHGAVGLDFSDGDASALSPLASHYGRHGVTSFLATTMTLPEDALIRAAQIVAGHKRGSGQARCIGLHLEGPFFSFSKRGAQNPDHLHAPDYHMFTRINQASGGLVKLVAVAPELEGALDFIEKASKICAVSLAHTAAGYAQAQAGFAAGATQATHLFNGMNEFLHREPGLVGAAMDSGAYAELICDGIHNHPAVVRAAFAMFPGRVLLISDSLRCAGMPEGEYVLGGQMVSLHNGVARLEDGTIAGSRITVLEAVQNAVKFGIPLETAVAAATQQPAAAIGMADTLGCIAIGRGADLVLLNNALEPVDVWVAGERLERTS